MIEKKPGLFLLEKLRTIHLFEADNNWILGLIFGLRMVYSAEDQKHLSHSQWGVRPGRSTEQPDLFKTMSYAISRLTRTPIETLDNNAKACHDRIGMHGTGAHDLPKAARSTTVCMHDGCNGSSYSKLIHQNWIWHL